MCARACVCVCVCVCVRVTCVRAIVLSAFYEPIVKECTELEPELSILSAGGLDFFFF